MHGAVDPPPDHVMQVARSSAFYCERFGFERGYHWPNESVPRFVAVSLGPFSLGLSETNAPAPAGRFALWLYANDVEAEIEALRKAGVEVLAEPADMEWGERMATVADPDGNAIHLGQRKPRPA
jgi:lactoylglutathione lyase